jgi:tetratricopeptide (TPR) repeat protein
MSGESARTGTRGRVVLLTGLLLTVLSHLNTLTFSFVYDDHQIKGARSLDLGALAGSFTQHLWAGVAQYGGYYRPVLKTWVALLYSVFGQNTVAWHVAAVAMHLLVTWLVYLVVVEVSRDRWLAAVTASVFGIHPVHVEVVAWISGAMSEGLLAALVVGSLLCYLRARRAPRPLAWYAASWMLFAAALLVKETAIVLPLVMAVYEWVRPGEEGASRPRPLNLVALMAPYGTIAVVYVVVRHLVLRNAAGPAMTAPIAGAASPMLTLPSAAWFYLRQLAWPDRLSIFQPVLRVTEPGPANFWLPLLGVALAAAVLIVIARRSRLGAFAACFLIAMLLVPLAALYALPKYEIVHDRYLYLPSIGFSILVALAVRRLAPRMARPGIVLLLAGIAVTIVTATQGNYWTNDLALYRRATVVAPNNAMAFNLLANEMYKRNQPQAALELYAQALRLDPQYWATNFAMGITECELGQFQDCERHLETASEVDASNSAEFASLADARMRLGNYAGSEEALRRGIQASPSAPQLHYQLGLALMRQGKLDEAQQALADEARVNPTWATIATQRIAEARTMQREGGWQSWRPGPGYP